MLRCAQLWQGAQNVAWKMQSPLTPSPPATAHIPPPHAHPHQKLFCSLLCAFHILVQANNSENNTFISKSFMRGNHRWLVNSPHKRPIIRKTFPFHYVIIEIHGLTRSCATQYHPEYQPKPCRPVQNPCLHGYGYITELPIGRRGWRWTTNIRLSTSGIL